MWDLWQAKLQWSWFSPNTLVSPVNHPTSCSTLIINHHLDVPSGLNLTLPREIKKLKQDEIFRMTF
jgi:hypothetical protein